MIFKNPITNDLLQYNINFDNTQFDEFAKVMQSTNLSAKQVAQTMDFEVNPAFISYAENTDRTQLSTSGLEKHIKSTNASFIKMSVKSKIAAVGVGLLNSAMSAGISLLAGYIISGVINYFDDLRQSAEEIAQAADEARSKISELNNELMTKQNLVKTSAQRYAELAQGINQFTGENNELSTEEYNEFLNLSNQLAETFPTLSRTYTQNGDAIIDLKGDVDTIVGSLEELINKSRELTNINIAKEAPAVFKDVLTKSKEYETQLSEYETKLALLQSQQSALSTINTESFGIGNIMIADDDVNKMYALEDAYTSLFNAAEVQYTKSTPNSGFVDGQKYDVVFEYNLDEENLQKIKENLASSFDSVSAEYQKQINELQENIKLTNENSDSNWTSLNSSVFGWLGTNDTYKVLSDEMQTAVQKMTNNIDWSTALFQGMKIENWSDVEGYIQKNILGIVSKIPDTLQTEFTSLMTADLPTGELISKYIELISNIIDQLGLEADEAESTKQRFLALISSDQDLLQRSRNKIKPSISNGYDKQNKYEWLDTLDSSELELLLTLDIDKDMSLENIKAALAEAQKMAESTDINLDPIYTSLQNLQSAYQTVSKAVKEYAENKYLSYDTLESLLQLDDKYLVGLMDENGQLQLNEASFRGLAEAKLQELSVSIMLDAIDTINSLKDEEAAKNYLKDSTFDLTQARWEDVEASIAQAESSIAAAKANNEDTTAREAALNQIAESTRTKIELIKGTIGSLGKNFNGVFNGSGSGGTKTKFSEQIDWAANSLSNLNNQMDILKEKLDNTFNISDKLDIYEEMKGLNKQIVKATKETSETYETAWTKASGKISSSYKNKIMSGDTFSVEDFSNETTYKNVTAAQEAWEKWQQSIKDYNAALISQFQLDKDESNAIIADKEAQLDVLDMQLESASTSEDKNKILDEQLELQKEINDELEKQAILEGNTNALAELAEKEKQQEKENKQKKRDNKRAENQVYIDTYDALLDDDSLTDEDTKSLLKSRKDASNRDFKYQFQEIVADIGDNTWNAYIKSLKEQYGETKMTDKKFIKEHLDEIASYFDYAGMLQWLNDYYESNDDYDQSLYDVDKNIRTYKVNNNDNEIQDIQNAIALNNGVGTEEQYTTMSGLYETNKGIWEEQLIAAKNVLKTTDENTAAWDAANAEVQELENKINSCDTGIKECNVSILELPLKEIEESLKNVNKQLDDVNKQISDYDEYISAANFIIDEQIKFQEEQKENIQEQIDALQKEHDLRESNLEVQKAEWNLQKAKNNRTNKVFKEGQGFVYEADADEVNDAQQSLDEAMYNKKISLLEDQIDTYDEEINRLNDIKENFNNIKSEQENIILLNKAMAYDADFFNKVLSSDVELITTFKNKYQELLTNKDLYETEQENLTDAQGRIEDIVEQYKNGKLEIDQAQLQIDGIINQTDFTSPYGKEIKAIGEAAQKKIEELETTKQTYEEKIDVTQSSNEEILESYNNLYENLNGIFNNMTLLIESFVANTQSMATSVSQSLASIKAAMNEISSIETSTSAKISKSVNSTYQKVSDDVAKQYANLGSALMGSSITAGLNIGAITTTPTVTTTNNSKTSNVSFTGDIIVNSTGDVNALSKDIVSQLPGAMLQTIYKNK